MTERRFDRAQSALLWIGRYVFRFFITLIALVGLVAYDLFPALDGSALHVGAPAALMGLVLWRALRAARRDSIMVLARIILVVAILLGGGTAMLLMSAWHEERLCKGEPQGRSCSDLERPIIRFFNGRGPVWDPIGPTNH
jgi:hypothetical protein